MNFRLLILIFFTAINASWYSQSYDADTAKINSLLHAGQDIYINEPAKAKDIWEEALEIIENMGLSNEELFADTSLLIFKSDLCFNLNQVSRNLGETDQTIKYLEAALEIDEYLQNKEYMSSTYNDLGVIMDDLGLFEEALDYYIKSLDIDRELGNTQGVSASLINVGNLHIKQGNHQEAIIILEESLSIQEESNDSLGMAVSLNNMATAYIETNKLDTALRLSRRAIAICKEKNVLPSLANSYSNSGKAYLKKELYDSVDSYYNKALLLREKTKDMDGMVSSLIDIADLNTKQGFYKEALSYANRAYVYAEDIGFKKMISTSTKKLSKIHEKLNENQEALFFLKKHMDIENELKKNSYTKSLYKAQYQSEYEGKRFQDSIVNAQASKEREIQAKLDEEIIKKNRFYIVLSLIGLLVLSAASLILVRTNRRKHEANKIIESQKYEVEKQKTRLEKQHEQLEESHKEISDSIVYAKRLQQAILPKQSELTKVFKNCLVFFAPKDVVSGDFYWMTHKNDVTLLAVADCTGHGVPGAMVSVVCSNALYRSVNEYDLIEPKLILDKTRELVIETFARSGKDVKDGMDISLLAIKGNEVTFAGANNALWIIRQKEKPQIESDTQLSHNDTILYEIKGDKQPIGLATEMSPFSQSELALEKEDMIFMTTDGYADQFGGEKGKKMKSKTFKQYLLEISDKPTERQQTLIRHIFDNWKGDFEQLDDVCVLGIKF